MKRVVFAILAVFFFFLPFTIFAHEGHAQADVEHIGNFISAITIKKDGTIAVKEHIEYDFASLSRHGIYRTIPYIKTNDAGKEYAVDFSEVSVQDENGTPYKYKQGYENGEISWKIGDPDSTITGVHTYHIRYTASGALTYFPGHDELYWNVVGTNWQVPIAKASAVVELPESVSPEDLHVACFTGSAGSTATDCEIKTSGGKTAVVETTTELDAFEGLTVVIGFPKGVVAVLEPRELVPFFDTWWGKVVFVLLIIAALLWYVVAPIVVIRKWWTQGRDPKPAMGEVRAWFSPPKNHHHRSLTPAETGTLIDERADLRDIYASIVDLARRGYLTIIETKKNMFDLEKHKEQDTDLLPFEKELLLGLFKSGDRVSVRSIDLTKTLDKVKSMLYESLVHDKFFPTNPNTLRGWYIALAVVALMSFNPILFLVALIFGQNMPRKTLFGAEQAAIARSLKNFLTSQDKQLAFQARNQIMFEKLLAFAVAFGVEEIWAARFKSLGLKNPDWYKSSTGSRFNSVVFAHSLGHGMSSSFAASIAAHSSTGSSSGFSGGSSGGGGGGGGGGGW